MAISELTLLCSCKQKLDQLTLFIELATEVGAGEEVVVIDESERAFAELIVQLAPLHEKFS